jgi:filamentous hemagglutinin family protein
MMMLTDTRIGKRIVTGIAGAVFWVFATTSSQAQIRVDSSLGRPAQSLNGPDFQIPQSIGLLAGRNLFHSFQTFNIGTGESATFTTSSAGIANVISRVTGGNPSTLSGILRLSAASGAPNLFFINPAGVTFGPGASIDVPGAFHVGTEHYLKFPDGDYFADTSRSSTFSAVDPVAFGFLDAGHAGVVVKDVILQNGSKDISIVAGDVQIDHAALTTRGGSIRVVAAGTGETEWPIDALPLKAVGGLDIINGGAFVTEADSSSGGNIAISAGAARITSGGWIGTVTNSSSPAGSIHAELGSLLIDGRTATASSGITSQAAIKDTGAAGNVSLFVRDDITILGGGLITSDTYGLGHAGDVLVKTRSILLDGSGHPNHARITNRAASGDAGLLLVESTDSIRLINGSQISSDSFGAGKAGSIRLHAGNNFDVLSDSIIASDAYARGDAGNISVLARALTVDGTGGTKLTQISSQAFDESEGNAGTIDITTAGPLTLVNGGKIQTNTYASGQAGVIRVAAGSLLLDSRGSSAATGIFSANNFGVSGDAGAIDIKVAGDAQILESAKISTNTWGLGNGGNLHFVAANLLIDGRDSLDYAAINSEAMISSRGHGGNVDVKVAGHLRIGGYGFISSATSSTGDAGSVSVAAGTLTIDSGSRHLAGIESKSQRRDFGGNAGTVSVVVAGDAILTNWGYVRSDTAGFGKGGDLSISARKLSIDAGGNIASGTAGSAGAGNITLNISDELHIGGGGRIRSDTSAGGNAGRIDIEADRVVLSRGNTDLRTLAHVLSDTSGSGAAGAIGIRARSSLILDDGGFISSDTSGTGNGGTITISAPVVSITGRDAGLGASISSNTYAEGRAGRVNVAAGNLRIQGGDTWYPTGIYSTSGWSASGDAGDVEITARENLTVINGGSIDTNTYGEGNGGSVRISAGEVTVSRGSSSIPTRISSFAGAGSSGHAGNVEVNSDGLIALLDGGIVNSVTLSAGNAGSVKITAGSLLIDRSGSDSYTGISSAATAGSSGNAGSVDVVTRDQMVVRNGGAIDSRTVSSGNAGSVKVNAGSITIDRMNSDYTGITSAAEAESTGDAGNVNVVAAANLAILNGGRIDSASYSSGKAGAVNVHAADLLIEGRSPRNGVPSSINAFAAQGSSGQTGEVSVVADRSIKLLNGGELSIRNDATISRADNLVPTTLTVSSPRLNIQNAGITAASTGNIAASNLVITTRNVLHLDSGRITTSANQGNGGSIVIQGGQFIWLDKSQVTTSVSGITGNGGDITIRSDALALSSGFIQANTSARNATGGRIAIDVKALITSGRRLFLGGNEAYAFSPEVFGYNVIQAAAPDGVSGEISLASPNTDITGSLTEIGANLLDSGGLGRDPCRVGSGNSFVQTGFGITPPTTRGPLRLESATWVNKDMASNQALRPAPLADFRPCAAR